MDAKSREASLNVGQRAGAISKTILVLSNDPANPTFQLTLQGKVAKFAGDSPKEVKQTAGTKQ
jgi:hypothetical protein